MSTEIHRCQCEHCRQSAEHPDQRLHHQINLLMSRLDEQQKRWYAAVETQRRGYGGLQQVATITGLDEKTIRRGMDELAADLENRPVERIRLPGAGRPTVEKKRRRSKAP
jgi:hypothetical protein